MATSELIEALQALAHERKIDEFYLIERLEQSLAKSLETAPCHIAALPVAVNMGCCAMRSASIKFI